MGELTIDNLRGARRGANLSLAELAGALGHSAGWLSAIERGHGRIKGEEMAKLERALLILGERQRQVLSMLKAPVPLP